MSRPWGWCGLVLLLGCSHAPVGPPPTVVCSDPALSRELEGLAVPMAELYQAPWHGPIVVQLVDDDEWKRRATGRSAARDPLLVRAWLSAFGLRDPGADLVRSVGTLASEEGLARYDVRRQRLIVRQSALPRRDRRDLLLHELAHVYRYQQAAPAPPPPELGLDGALAGRAVEEGHADLTALLVAAEGRKGRDDSVRYRRTALPPVGFAALRALLLGGTGGIPEVARRQTTAAAWLEFPYTAGLRFFLEIYEAGGLALVQRTLLDPPRTTSEILHPSRFLSGGRPTRLPEDPDGQLSMPLGEAMLVLMLERCADPTLARRLAASYRGDLATLRRGPDSGAMTLDWESVWANESAAIEVERTFRTLQACPSLKITDPQVALSPEFQVARHGSRVRLFRGAETRTPADRPLPVGRSTSSFGAARPPAIFLATPGLRLEGTVRGLGAGYANGALGLTADIPARTSWWAPSPSGVLTLFGKDQGFLASISAFRQPPEEDLLPLLEEVALAGAEGDAGLPERFTRMNAIASTLGGLPARVVTWRRQANGEWLRVTSVPLCAGRLLVLVVDRWMDVDALAVLDDWRRSFAWGEPRLCKD